MNPTGLPRHRTADPRLLALLLEQLGGLYLVERWRHEILPDVASSAHGETPKRRLQALDGDCASQIDRIEQAFRMLQRPLGGPAEAKAPPTAHRKRHAATATGSTDAASIAAALELGGLEVAAYGYACSLARELGHTALVRLLARSLWEHSRARERLDRIGAPPGSGLAEHSRDREQLHRIGGTEAH